MTADKTGKDLTRRLAVIVFADIQGYTAIMQKDEKAAAVLLRKFRSTVEKTVPDHRGKIVDFYGDGVLCLFESPLKAVECAVSLQGGFMTSPEVPVRIGIHSGTVVAEDGRYYGNSINVASRIESMAVPASVLLSQVVRKELTNHPEFLLISLGRYAFKNVDEPIEVFALSAAGLKVPEKGSITGKFKARKPIYRNLKFAAALLLLLIITGYFFLPGVFGLKSQPGVPLNSIAVLPFENRSIVEENAFFADGIHDDLLTQLGKIGSMKVIARSSVMRFKESKPPLSEIAALLGVVNILEGSVSRLGDKVHITVQLIKAATSETLWSEIYDREITATNLFSIQTEIAKSIAGVLQTTISPQQKTTLEQQPTTNLEAYEAYLRAHQLIEVRNEKSLVEAKDLLGKAIRLDANFALAYIQLGTVHALMVEYANQDAERSYMLARENLEKGVSLDPQMVEAFALQGLLHYRADNDLEKATASFEKAIEKNPNYGPTFLWYANAALDLGGDMSKARDILQNALRINPLSPVLINRVALYSAEEGDIDRAINTYKKGIHIEPAYPNFWRNLCQLYSKNLGMLDSSGVYAHRSMALNDDRGRYLENFLIALENLDMLDEAESTLQAAKLNTWEDSLINLLQTVDLSFYRKDFEGAKSVLRRLNDDFGFNYKIAWIESDFFQNEYRNTIGTFERLYPDSDGGEHLTPFAMSDLKAFQTYVFCLKQVGEEARADSLWVKYGGMVLEKPEGQDEYFVETKARELYGVRQDAIEGNYELAISNLEKYLDSGYLARWQFQGFDPVLDPLRNLTGYKQLMADIEKKVAKQRENFKAYLTKQGHTFSQ